jgi:uncharacterized protein YihD (DUF1040 family)
MSSELQEISLKLGHSGPPIIRHINLLLDKHFNLPYWSRGLRLCLIDILERASESFSVNKELLEELSAPSTYYIPYRTRLQIKDVLLDILDGYPKGKKIRHRSPREIELKQTLEWPLNLANVLDISETPLYPEQCWEVLIDYLINLLNPSAINYEPNKSKPLIVILKTLEEKENAERRLKNVSDKILTKHLKPIDVVEITIRYI